MHLFGSHNDLHVLSSELSWKLLKSSPQHEELETSNVSSPKAETRLMPRHHN